MIMFVLISLSGRHVSTFLLSRAVTEKNMLIKDTTKELFILTFFFFFQEANMLVSASFRKRNCLCRSS